MHSAAKTADQPDLADSASALDGPPKLVLSTFSDVNDQSSALSGGPDLHYAQLTCGQFSGSCRALKMRHFQVLRETNNIPVNMYGTLWPQSFVFGMPLRMLGNGSFNGLTLGPRISLIIRGDRDHEAILPPADMVYLAVDAHVLEDYICDVEGVSLAGWLTQGPIVLPESAAIIGLSAHLLDLLNYSFGSALTTLAAQAQRDILQEVLARVTPIVLGHLGSPGPSKTSVGRYKLVQRAREFVLDRVGAQDPVQIIDVCRALAVSRRTLQYSFEEVLGLNPATYLRVLRLNRARRDLLANDVNALQVKDVASRWGFWHLSRFGAEYRELYGELPSVTLKNPRAQRARPSN
jgi:AraC family transcriptional regulator, ethanolamine operon transcriptional activator